MNCPRCGAVNQHGAGVCAACGQPLAIPPPPPVAVPPPAQSDIGQNAGMRMLLPVGRSWVAILAGYVGLLAVLIVPAPLALALGILAIVHIKKHPGTHGMGRAIFAIVMGALVCIPFAIVAVIALIR